VYLDSDDVGRLRPPKSGKVRAVPLIHLAAARLDGLSRRELFTQPGDLVFPGALGGYMSDSDLRPRFYATLRVAGLRHKRHEAKPITFHDLPHVRHSRREGVGPRHCPGLHGS
jgi:hypothetical protein